MIHVILGTKAQLIKMAPVLLSLKAKSLPYNLVFTGQHHKNMENILAEFRIKKADIILNKGKDILSLPALFFWSVKLILQGISHRNTIFKGDKKGIVLVHGDTLSTITGALMGKIAGLKVGHVESGLRSFDIFHPFPEELTRRLTAGFTDIHFCPGTRAVKNLKNSRGKKINTINNTLIDSLHYAIKQREKIILPIPEKKYCVAAIHRYENLRSKKSFLRIIEIIERIAEKILCVFVLHPVTKKRLHQYNLFSRLKNNPGIELHKRHSFFQFIKLVFHSEFIVTDGGSNQEECSYMGKPCLLLRKKTERTEGLDQNVCLSKLEIPVIDHFINHTNKYIRPFIGEKKSPSEVIADAVKHFA